MLILFEFRPNEGKEEEGGEGLGGDICNIFDVLFVEVR